MRMSAIRSRNRLNEIRASDRASGAPGHECGPATERDVFTYVATVVLELVRVLELLADRDCSPRAAS